MQTTKKDLIDFLKLVKKFKAETLFISKKGIFAQKDSFSFYFPSPNEQLSLPNLETLNEVLESLEIPVALEDFLKTASSVKGDILTIELYPPIFISGKETSFVPYPPHGYPPVQYLDTPEMDLDVTILLRQYPMIANCRAKKEILGFDIEDSAFLGIEKGKLKLKATNSIIMGEISMEPDENDLVDIHYILPHKLLSTVAQFAKKRRVHFKTLSDSRVIFSFSGGKFWVGYSSEKSLKREFPQIDFPQDSLSFAWRVKAKDLLSGLSLKDIPDVLVKIEGEELKLDNKELQASFEFGKQNVNKFYFARKELLDALKKLKNKDFLILLYKTKESEDGFILFQTIEMEEDIAGVPSLRKEVTVSFLLKAFNQSAYYDD